MERGCSNFAEIGHDLRGSAGELKITSEPRRFTESGRCGEEHGSAQVGPSQHSQVDFPERVRPRGVDELSL